MENSDDSRKLTPKQLEEVVRRAAELQDEQPDHSSENVSEMEMVRIGQELGLEPANVRRAMAEVRNQPNEGNALMRAMGVRYPSAQRMVQQPAEVMAEVLEDYLREKEQMVPERRFPDRTRYARDTSLAGVIGRIKGRFTRTHRPLGVERVDVVVSPVDDENTLVEVSADLRDVRLGLTIASAAIGVPPAIVALALNSITDPWILLAPAALAVPWLFFRTIYGTVQKSVRESVESLLDRVEHDEL